MSRDKVKELSPELIDHLISCTVRLNSGDKVGTGFFVSPGLILTCAHVIAEQEPLTIRWNNHAYPGEVAALLKPPDPDLALVRITGIVPDHPCTYFVADTRLHDPLFSYGYTDEYPNGDSATFKYEGASADSNNQVLLKLKQGQARPGLSGAPLLNERTGGVCGVVKRSRDKSTDLGGRAVGITLALSQWPTLLESNNAFHARNASWVSLMPATARPANEIDWHLSCAEMLADNRRLTTNALTTNDGTNFGLEEIYVPLGLIERRRQSRRPAADGAQTSAFEGSRLREPAGRDDGEQAEVIKTFSHDEFFEQVLINKQSPKSNGRRLAIIGEPGAGKTTLLQKIALWLLANSDYLPIWVSLADLRGKPLRKHLIEDWIENAARKAIVTPEMQESLVDQFRGERVFLLLDGLDEMAADASNPLQAISNELKGWLADARIILSCRQNVWDAGKNALEVFDTYVNLDFSYGGETAPDQVGQFISRWFSNAPELGVRLRAELDLPGRERIRDTVRNPLRLALLCRTWNSRQGNLPNTKAALYKQFIEAFYEWKQESFPLRSGQQLRLNEALGRLAVKALKQEKNYFRLDHTLISGELGGADDESFTLALQLGWLNLIGVAAEEPSRKVYAFLHPTFQEYFAAQAIKDHTEFISDAGGTPPPAQGVYRVFEPQWREVILLWVGREDLPDHEKERLLEALVNFDDKCLGLYQYRAFFLAAVITAEFKEHKYLQAILLEVTSIAFNFELREKQWTHFCAPLPSEAAAALRGANRETVISLLLDFLRYLPQDWNLRAFHHILDVAKEVAVSDQAMIDYLIELTESKDDPKIRGPLIRCLAKIGVGSPKVLTSLIRLLDGGPDQETLNDVLWALDDIGVNNLTAINAVVELFNTTDYRLVNNRRKIVRLIRTLNTIAVGDERAVATIIKLLEDMNPDNILYNAIESLGVIGVGSARAVEALTDLLWSAQEDDFDLATVGVDGQVECLLRAAENLSEIDPGNRAAIDAVIDVIKGNEYHKVYQKAVISVEANYDDASPERAKDLADQLYAGTRRRALELLGRIGAGSVEAKQALSDVLETEAEELNRMYAASSLAELDPGNPAAVNALLDLLKTVRFEESRRKETPFSAASRLSRIAPNNPTAIEIVLDLLKDDDEETRRLSMHLLRSIGSPDRESQNALISLLDVDPNYSLYDAASRYLNEHAVDKNEVILTALKVLETGTDVFTKGRAIETLGEIGHGHPAAINALVEFLRTETDSSSAHRSAIKALGNIGAGNAEALDALIEKLYANDGKAWPVLAEIAESIKAILRYELFPTAVAKIKDLLTTANQTKKHYLYQYSFSIMWYCVNNMNYPYFYSSFHGGSKA